MSRTILNVLLPIYDAQRFLPEALDSLLAQTFKDFEVIAVNDGSTDNSLKILEAYAAKDRRLRVVSRPNTGIVGALNNAISEGKAPLLARMDADDITHPSRFAKQLAFLEQHPDVVAVGSWVRMVWVDGSPIFEYQTPTAHEEIKRQLLDGNGGSIIHPSAIFRREAIEAVGGYREEALWFEDLDLYLRLLDQGRLANLPEVLLDYRQHLGSVNQSSKAALLRHQKRAGILNTHRQRFGLPPMPADESALNTTATTATPRTESADPAIAGLQHWIGLARSSGHTTTARKLACLLVRRRPFSKRSWQLLRYSYGKSS